VADLFSAMAEFVSGMVCARISHAKTGGVDNVLSTPVPGWGGGTSPSPRTSSPKVLEARRLGLDLVWGRVRIGTGLGARVLIR
jgi:hypothetical protein